MEPKKKIIPKVLLVTWLVFSLLYVVNGEYNRLQNMVAKSAYEKGFSTAVSQIIEQSKACKAIPLTVDDTKAEIVNIDCLKNPNEPAKEPEKTE